MWQATRYGVVLWGYPPHKFETILPSVIALLDRLTDRSLVWHHRDQPSRIAPASHDQWVALAKELQEQSNFRSLDASLTSTSGLSISVGFNAPAFVRNFDVLAINLNAEHLLGTQAIFTFEETYTLFTKSIDLFQPFWSEVCDHELTRTDEIDSLRFSVDRTQVPDTIHWFNYFDHEMVKRLGGEKKLLTAPAYEVRKWENPPGILLILQREPFDIHNLEHREKYEEIVQYLELDRLHSLYPRKREVHPADHSLSDP
jgi:hypothetical protein